MINTVEKPEDKRDKLKRLREFHQSELTKLGVPDAVFIPKMAYTPYGKYEKHIAFFLSEINRGEDVFVEFCSKELDPEDPKRTLYKWLFNAHYQTEYDVTEAHAITGHVRYLIPVAELVIMKVNTPEETVSIAEEKSANIEFSLDNPDEGDVPMSQMSMRDYAAIHLKKPVSRKKWLNELISSGF